jgi:hypothetical protein
MPLTKQEKGQLDFYLLPLGSKLIGFFLLSLIYLPLTYSFGWIVDKMVPEDLSKEVRAGAPVLTLVAATLAFIDVNNKGKKLAEELTDPNKDS